MKIPAKLRNHFLRDVKLPIEALHRPKMYQFVGDGWKLTGRDCHHVIVSAIDTHGAIIRRKGCARYYAELENLFPVESMNQPKAD